MNDYPDPDEEYELMHADEFELMNELDQEDVDLPAPRVTKPTPKRQLDFSNTTNASVQPAKKPAPNHVVVSADEYPSDDDLLVLQDVPEPTTSEERINDEPVIVDPSSNDHLESVANNKRSVDSLFGDISDIEFELSSQSKRQKLEEEIAEKGARQDQLIKTIVERRKKINEEKRSAFGRQHGQQKPKRLEDCICAGSVPKWPFMPASVNGERVYIRMYTEEKVQKELKSIECAARTSGLLGVPYKELYSLAVNEMSRNIDKKEAKKEIIREPLASSKDLWVEKYKPKIYLQLLSDEATNRSLLYWLKLWDKVVFNKEPKVIKKGFPVMEKRDLLDEHHRPLHKVALLCGPPGLGKTTLAHMIAKQAGYCPVEVNASDDRSAQAFRTQLEAATQMKSVMGASPQPNCLILDEIDGAPQAAVDVLIKYVTDKGDARSKKKKGFGILKRPIICICNDIYVPALRSLRQIAFTIVFPPTSSSRLGERLMEITKMENIITDLGTMMVLSEKSNNDIRSCLSILQYMKAKGVRITLGQVQSSTMGRKDMQQGLFSVWESIFQIKLSKRGQGASVASKLVNSPAVGTGMSGRLYDVLRTVQSYGDYDRLAVGVFENYAKVRNTEISLTAVVQALNCFVFHDFLSTYINTSQNYAVYAYLPWSFVTWHSLFASIQRPKLSYPTVFYDVTSRTQRNRQILDVAFSGMCPKLQSNHQRSKILLDVAPLLVDLITPNVRPISVQLYTQKEKDELSRVVSAMADYNVNYSQVRTPEGQYTFQLDPDLESLACFGERPKENITSYTVKQLLSKEVQCEKIRRTTIKTSDVPNSTVKIPAPIPEDKTPAVTAVPNHLQKLTPKALKKKVKDVQAKDFFGRVVEQSLSKVKSKAKTDEIVKSDIWFHFKEGYNNAVRKNVYISDLL